MEKLARKARKFKGARYLKWGLIHAALIIFFSDLIAAVWPAFAKVWEGHAHIAIALASLTATVAEYLSASADEEKDQ